MLVTPHKAIVKYDCEDWDLAASGRFDVESDHAEGCVSHDIHRKPIRLGELSSHDQAESGAKLGGFSPPDIAMGNNCLIEGDDLITRIPRVMGQHRFCAV